MAEPAFFATEADFRRWLAANHATAPELLVGFWKKSSGKPSIDWPQARDQALCFGWIDGIRKSMGEDSYTIRFTPRRKGSIWSAINTKRAGELIAEGRMRPAGRTAFEARSPEKTAIYSYEREAAAFSDDQQRRFEADAPAWAFFQAQAPSWRRAITHWVSSAKREETRERRFNQLIEDSRAGRRTGALG